MRKVVILSIFALVVGGVFFATPASATGPCACVSETVDGDSGPECHTTCCNNGVPSEPPSEPPSEAPPVCGEICLTHALTDGATGVNEVEQLILIAGSDQSGQPAGCVALLGGAINSNQDDPTASCVGEAVAECELGGCATTTIAAGACS